MGDGKTLHDVQQRLHYRYITAIIAGCLLVACGPRNDVYNPSHFAVHSVVAPPDVAVPKNWSGASFDFDGLYVETPQALACCWIAAQATLYVRKSGPADKLVAGFWVPNFPAFANGQRVRIALPGDANADWQDLDANGAASLDISVPPALRNATGLIPVQITSANVFVPNANAPPSSLIDRLLVLLGLRAPQLPNTDRRSLGIILRYLYFDSKSGPNVGAVSTPSASSQAPFFPIGVAPPTNWQEQQRSGVWSADTRASCCFLAKRAAVHLTNPAGAQMVAFDIFVPSYGPLTSKPVTLTCAFNGVTAGPPVRLTLGKQTVTFAVPAALRNTPNLTATLESSVTWVPAHVGLGKDRRELSVMLQRVGYI
ncbi:MAG TPA: hypothetical protein VFE36_14025 [Candidatus Baltobacteraceae bacterium]|nr:hypothetical protein [Candidatus Baltobacteraceae bacterium]